MSSSSRAQARAVLDDRDLGAEAAVHLAELQADVAAADDRRVPGRVSTSSIDVVREVGDVRQAGDVGHRCAAADVEEDRSAVAVVVDATVCGPSNRACPG